jgi:hypothetical protein
VRTPAARICRVTAFMLAWSKEKRSFGARWFALCALLSVLALAAGCGGDGGDGGLSSKDKLQVIQSRADIGEFCSVQDTGTNDLYDRSLGVMLDGVRDLARIYQEHPDAQIEIPVEKKSFTMDQVMREQIAALRKCGRDGRLQAGVLEAAVQQQQS